MSERDETTGIEYGRCPVCGHVFFPLLESSPCGHAGEPVHTPFTEVGEVYSWTVFRLGDEPTTIVMADFFDGRIRVTAPMLDSDAVEIGDQVRLVSGRDTPYAIVPAG